MFVLEALLSLVTNTQDSVFQASKMLTNASICPVKITLQHELCNTPECTNPVFLNKTSFDLPASLCVDVIMRSQVCTTDSCLSTATRIIERMDESVDPCNNFYNFVCGNFTRKAKPYRSSGRNTYHSTRNQEVKAELRLLVAEPIETDEPYSGVLSKTLFQACADITSIRSAGMSPLTSALDRLGGWPLLAAAWDDAAFDLQTFVENCRVEGYPLEYLYGITSYNWPTDDSTRYFYISVPRLEIDFVLLARGSWTAEAQELRKYIENVAHTLGAQSPTLVNDIDDLMEFNVKLAQLVRIHNSYPQVMTIQNLEARLTTYRHTSGTSIPTDWYIHINKLLAPNFRYSTNQEILVHIEFLKQLLALITVTPKRTVANYALWRVVRESLEDLKFDPNLEQIRYSECERLTSKKLPYATAALFVRKYETPNLMQHIKTMSDNIRNQMKNNLNKITWMEKVDHDKMMHRLDTINYTIGRPSDIMKNNLMETYYKTLHLSNEYYFESLRNITIHKYDYLLKKPWQSYNESSCGTEHEDAADLLETQGYYSACSNNIVSLSLPIVTGDFFSEFRPENLNYGSLGFIVAHELTHAADSDVAQKKLASSSYQKYRNKVGCLNKQFSAYSMNGMMVNAQNTEHENVADLNGLKVAYAAFKEFTETNQLTGTYPQLPGLTKYTSEQLFWMSFAFPFCSVYTARALRELLVADEHAPGRFRVDTVRNLPEFSADFRCHAQSPMNPPTKCSPVFAP